MLYYFVVIYIYREFIFDRCSDLKTKITALKKKESEETQALENAVANVEKNLVASTVRSLY